MLSARKIALVMEIEKVIERGEEINGVYSEAYFKIDKNEFYINAKDSIIYKNGEVANLSIVNNGRYKYIHVEGDEGLFTHQFVAICLLKDASKKLISNEDYTINHKSINKDSFKKPKEARIKYDSMVVERLFDKNAPEPDKSLLLVCDDKDDTVQNLEVCTRSDNINHSCFIKTFDLYGVMISAKDIKKLKDVLIDKVTLHNVITYYLKTNKVPSKESLI